MYDLIIRNGSVVSPSNTIITDIAVKDGLIVTIGHLGDKQAKKVIDASKKFVMPGVIEAHMHCMAPFQGCFGANDFYTQSVSGAFGGVTMFMDFTNTFKGGSVLKAVEERKKEMAMSAIDYSIHGKFVEAPQNILDEIPEIVAGGIPTFKLFMTYRKEGVMAEDETLIKVFEYAKEYEAIPMLHCESNPIAELNNEKFAKAGDLSWKMFAKAKPVICEAEAFARALYFTEYVGNAVIIVHTTNLECIELTQRAHKKKLPVYVETCPHYLTLSEELYEGKNGHLAICSPPLRNRKEAEALWRALKDGTVSLTGSDDCTYSFKEKSMFLEKDSKGEFIQDYTKVVNGMSGLELRLPILLSEGVSKNRLTINEVCALTSENIAKVYGCFPRKGVIRVGSDADMVIVDMNKEVILTKDILHNNIDYCLHEGMQIKGYPEITIAGGEVIVENGNFKGKKGAGKFIARKIDNSILNGFGLTVS